MNYPNHERNATEWIGTSLRLQMMFVVFEIVGCYATVSLYGLTYSGVDLLFTGFSLASLFVAFVSRRLNENTVCVQVICDAIAQAFALALTVLQFMKNSSGMSAVCELGFESSGLVCATSELDKFGARCFDGIEFVNATILLEKELLACIRD